MYVVISNREKQALRSCGAKRCEWVCSLARSGTIPYHSTLHRYYSKEDANASEYRKLGATLESGIKLNITRKVGTKSEHDDGQLPKSSSTNHRWTLRICIYTSIDYIKDGVWYLLRIGSSSVTAPWTFVTTPFLPMKAFAVLVWRERKVVKNWHPLKKFFDREWLFSGWDWFLSFTIILVTGTVRVS